MTIRTRPGRVGAANPTAGDVSAVQPWVMLGMATLGFALSFWAWALLGPLGTRFRELLELSFFQQSLVVAVPIVVGSLGRIPIGALTDRWGARVMFPAVTAMSILPVLFLGFFGDSYLRLLVGGFFLGIAGTSFAVGVPFVNGWFPRQRRGLVIGIFGMGMGGTAISAFTTVGLVEAEGAAFPFVLLAALLAAYAAAALLILREAPGHAPAATGDMRRRVWQILRLRPTIEAAALYALGFGGFVAFSVYLPTYLHNAYDLNQSDAAFRTAGFVVLAVVARPVGGWLSDRLHPVPVLFGCFSALTALAFVASAEPALMPWGTVAFLGMATALGAAAGTCFALVARTAPAGKVGAVTGVVGAAGGLGGFIPPLVMGTLYSATGSYSLGLAALAAVAAVAAGYLILAMPTDSRQRA